MRLTEVTPEFRAKDLNTWVTATLKVMEELKRTLGDWLLAMVLWEEVRVGQTDSFREASAPS